MIPYGRQSIDEEDISFVVEALRSEWLTTGPRVEKFEFELEAVLGAPTIAVSSGTAALHCAYAAIEIEPGDEVITPPITFIATQATAAIMGAKIVFADVLPSTANIDPKAVEAVITPKTKAIVAVDFAGHPADLDELRLLADKFGVYLIEDAAHSIGSTYKNRPVGSIADLTTFSFFPTKNMTTCEGGAVSSPNPKLLDKARKFARQGLTRDKSDFRITSEGAWHQEVHNFGLNYRLPDVLCALGISQLRRLQLFKERRREIFDYYEKSFSDLELIKTPFEKDFVHSNWHLFPIRVPKSERRRIFDFLRKNDIGVQVNYLPAHLHPVFESAGFKRGDFPIAEDFYDTEISLPIHLGLTPNNLEKIVELVKKLEL